MPSDEVAFLRVKIEGADVSEQVWDLDLEDVDRGSDKVTFVMNDPDSANSDGLQDGESVRVELGWETEYALAFEGEIVDVKPVAAGSPRVQVVAYDVSHRMTRAKPSPSRQYTGTLEKILTDIMKLHSIPVGKIQIDPMPSWPNASGNPLLQQNQNDWQFIQSLAEQYRARAFVEVNAEENDSQTVRARGGSSRFYFITEDVLLSQKPMGKLLFCPGMGRLLEFNYSRVGSGASPSATATVANPLSGDAATKTGPEPAAGPAPEASPDRSARIASTYGEVRSQAYAGAVEVAAGAATQPQEMRAQSVLTGLPSDPELVDRAVKQDRTRILGFQGKGVAMGTVFLRAKGPVEIEGLASWAAGTWYVSRVNHVLQRTRIRDKNQLTYRSRFQATR